MPLKPFLTRLNPLKSSSPNPKDQLFTTTAQTPSALFAPTNPTTDGEDCLHDCTSCSVHLPRGFKIDEDDELYGKVNGWATHLLVATGKTDWRKHVEEVEGSVMEAVAKTGAERGNGKVMSSACNLPVPESKGGVDSGKGKGEESEKGGTGTTVLLLPAFVVIEPVRPVDVPSLLNDYVDYAPTTTSDLRTPFDPTSSTLPAHIHTRPLPHAALILLCSQRTRDARCGQSAPLLKREFERHLRPLGLWRDMGDDRAGGVSVVFISHVGGHKYSANCMIYRRAGAFGGAGKVAGDAVGMSNGSGASGTAEQGRETPDVERVVSALEDAGLSTGDDEHVKSNGAAAKPREVSLEEQGASQCIWLARVRPEDCENIVRYTLLQGKVVKPDRQLRGGFDRGKGVVSW